MTFILKYLIVVDPPETPLSLSLCVFLQDFYDEQGVFSESFWPQSEPAQAMAFNPRGRVAKPLTPPPSTQSISNQVSENNATGTTRSASTLFFLSLSLSKRNAMVKRLEKCQEIVTDTRRVLIPQTKAFETPDTHFNTGW